MRIISGSLRRRPIRVPRGVSLRPTTDRTREAIFNLVAARIGLDGRWVLDLFAGSGALGLEAISRGASHVVFVENDPRIARAIRDNTEQLGVESSTTIVVDDALRFVTRYDGQLFDVVLADPPYDFGRAAELPDLVLHLVKQGGLLILEHEGRHSFSDHRQLLMERSYGRTQVSLFGRRSGENESE